LDAKRAIDMGTRLALRIKDDEIEPGDQGSLGADVGAEEKMFNILKGISG